MRYHVNTETGRYGPCGAKEGNCPLGGDSKAENHYDSIEESQTASTKLLVERHGLFSTSSRKKHPSGTAGFIDLSNDENFRNVDAMFPQIAGARIRYGGQEFMVGPVPPFGRLGLLDEDGNHENDVENYSVKFATAKPRYSLVGGPDTEHFRKEMEVVETQNKYREARKESDNEQGEMNSAVARGRYMRFIQSEDDAPASVLIHSSVSYPSYFLKVSKNKNDGSIVITPPQKTWEYDHSVPLEDELVEAAKRYPAEKWLKLLSTYEKEQKLRLEYHKLEAEAENYRFA